MKLRNKKTGEIILTSNLFAANKKSRWYYESLKEFNEEWEDYEEQKGWYIDISCTVRPAEPFFGAKNIDILKQCGNYFETKEEAEKAVEKLKAWKRLKDKGFRFDNFIRDAIYYDLREDMIQDKRVIKDLELLFRGDE